MKALSMFSKALLKFIPIVSNPVSPVFKEKTDAQLITKAKKEMHGFLHQSFCSHSCPRQLVIPRDRIKEIMLKHGYEVKEGHTDLKEYVYLAAEELIREAIQFKKH